MIESGFALMVAFLINVSVISVSGAVCNSPDLNAEDKMNCQDLDLNKASFLLRVCPALVMICYVKICSIPNLEVTFILMFYNFYLQNFLGSWSSKLFAVALLASGQSSTITGTYAGQYVMQVSCWKNNIRSL